MCVTALCKQHAEFSGTLSRGLLGKDEETPPVFIGICVALELHWYRESSHIAAIDVMEDDSLAPGCQPRYVSAFGKLSLR